MRLAQAYAFVNKTNLGYQTCLEFQARDASLRTYFCPSWVLVVVRRRGIK